MLDRGNTSGGSYVIELAGATNVTLDHLQITGGFDGLYADPGSSSTGLTVTSSTVFGNSNTQVDLESSNDRATFSGDTISGGVYGIYLSNVNDSSISGSSIDGTSDDGVYVYGLRRLDQHQ